YFPSSRRISLLPPFHGLSPVEQRAYRAGKDTRKYSLVVKLLLSLEHDAERANDFANQLKVLSPTIRYTPGPKIEGVPHCLSSRERAAVSPAEISDAEADAVIFAATATAIGLSRSIVFVDRPELYADPGFVPQLVAGLRGLGEHNQLILASSSPEL